MNPHEGQPVERYGVPLGEGRGVMIMIHGRNAAPRNILDLVPRLNLDGWTYLAPSAANGTWYPLSFMAETATNEPNLSSALSTVARLVSDIVAQGVPRHRIVLLGFSQGACLAAEFAVRHAARFGGVILFTGGLIGPPGTVWNYPGSFDGAPVFLGSSDVDAHVPQHHVDESAAVFERMGATVTKRIYPGMAHLVNDDEIAFARGMMETVEQLTPA